MKIKDFVQQLTMELSMNLWTSNNKKTVIVAILIALATVLVYLPARQNDFVNWDDNQYVYENSNIQSIDFAFFKWAFTSFHAANWHPLTWLSHMADVDLFGMNPGAHHLVSVALHAAAVVMLSS